MPAEWWNAPTCKGPLNATVTLPGSKSETARALVLRARAGGNIPILGALKSRDTELARRALVPGTSSVDCGLAGTVMRFVPALAAFSTGTRRFDGDPHARKRPITPLLDALERLGAKVRYLGIPGFLPFEITGHGGPYPAEVELDSSQSSQYLSALLLASPAPLRIRLTGRVPSVPHIRMTAHMLQSQGVEIQQLDERTWFTSGALTRPSPIRIDPDLSNAGPFLAAALVCGGSVTVANWPESTYQAGDAWRWILPMFGAEVSFTDVGLRVTHSGGRWPGVDIDLGDVGELAPTVAALAVLGESESRLRGIGHLRGHETDRLAAIATEISRCGGTCRVVEDGLVISPGRLRPADFLAYDDHRMATFGAILGLALPGSRINNIETTAKTLPDFVARWDAMLCNKPSPEIAELSVE